MKLAIAAVLLGLVGCVGGIDAESADDGVDFGVEVQDSTIDNGVSVNGVSVNGVSVNGVSVNGVSVNGVSVNGVSLVGAELAGATPGGQPLRGAQMVGALLTGTSATGAAVPLRIDSATQLAGDVWAYGVSAKSGSLWSSACGVSTTGVPIQAIAISGRWDYRDGPAGAGGWIADPTTMTFACRGKGAIAKCIELGYTPWRTVAGTSLRDYHTACVRMIRGDYCGNGHAYTKDGNKIDVYDRLGIQTDTEAWPIDAEWNVGGSRCIRKTRAALLVPLCVLKLLTPTCGTFATPSTLMVNEFNGPLISL